MADSQNPTTWEQFYSFLHEKARRSGSGGQELLKRLDELNLLAHLPDTERADFRERASSLLQDYGDEFGAIHHDFVKERDGIHVLDEASAWRENNFPTTPQEAQPISQQTPQGPTLADFLPKSGDHSGGGGDHGASTRQKAQNQLKEAQKTATISAFEHLLEITPEKDLPDAIESFYKTHLSAAGVLGNQYKILQAQAQKLYNDKGDLTQQLDALTKQKDEHVSQLNPIQDATIPDATLSPEFLAQRQREKENTEKIKTSLRGQAQNPQQVSQARNLALQHVRDAFDQQWRELSVSALDDAVRQFDNYGYSYRTSLNEGYDAVANQVITNTISSYQQPEAIPQRSFGGQSQQRQKGHVGQAVNRAGNVVRDVKKAGKELERGAKLGAEQGGRTIVASGGEGILDALAAALGIDPIVLIAILILVIVIIVIVAIIFLAVVIIILLANKPPQLGDTEPIPGLILSQDTNPPGKTTYANGQTVSYVIDARYSGQYSLVLTDTIPSGATLVPDSVTGQNTHSTNSVSWNLDANTPLSDSTSSTKHWKFNLNITPTQKDSVLRNIVSAVYAPGSGPGFSQNVSLSITAQPVQVGQALTTGACSPANLISSFGDQGTATIASCICKYESGGDPGFVNAACVQGAEKTYGIGLFQIDLLNHAEAASLACAQNIHYNDSTKTCQIVNQSTEASCVNYLKNPTNNIAAAVSLYQQAKGNWNTIWPSEKGKCY